MSKSYVSRLKTYREYEEPMRSILDAVDSGICKMKSNKKYQLRQIVELENPKLWKSLSNYEKRSVGHTFAMLYLKRYGDDLMLWDQYQAPRKYIRLD